MVKSEPDRNRIRQRVGKRKEALSKVRKVVAMWREGRSSPSCMEEIDDVIRACDLSLNQRDQAATR